MRVGIIWTPLFANFFNELNAAFNPADAVGDAMHKLRTLKQGMRSAEELVSEFNLFCSQAGITQSGDTTLINLFQCKASALQEETFQTQEQSLTNI